MRKPLHEIYFPAFEKSVKEGDVATIMTSYNLLNSVHASESEYLNYTVLRDMWGFDGISSQTGRQYILNSMLADMVLTSKCQDLRE